MSTTKYFIYPLTLMLLLAPLSVQAEEMPAETVQVATEPALEVPAESDMDLDAESGQEDVNFIPEPIPGPDTESQSGVEPETEEGTELSTEMESVTEMESGTETETETETEKSVVDKETSDLLKEYLTKAISGNDADSESASAENISPELENLDLKVGQIIELLNSQNLIIVLGISFVVLGLGLLAGLWILGRLR